MDASKLKAAVTADDMRKLKQADPVTVRLYVQTVVDNPVHPYACLTTDPDGDSSTLGNYVRVSAHDIVSIEPRPIAVGDTVRLDGIASLDWSVVHVHETRAWIERRDASGAKFADIVQLSDLTRADASDE